MITVSHIGNDSQTGFLGNKMFMVANAYACAKRAGDELILPPWEFQNAFKRSFPTTRQLYFDVEYHEPRFQYSPIPVRKNMNLIGYFQSEKYWYEMRDEIRSLFEPCDPVAQAIESQWGEILKRETLGIHVRRGDFLQLADHHPLQSLEYYAHALEVIGPVEAIIICSNDIAWCKQQFKGDHVFFSETYQEKSQGNVSALFDLMLLSRCTHQITANSTFSWWAGYLNRNPHKKVIVPKTWFGPAKTAAGITAEDIYPDEPWIAL